MAYIQPIERFIARAKQVRRLLDNYNVPNKDRIDRVRTFLEKDVLYFMQDEHNALDTQLQSEFTLLCDDIVNRSIAFLQYHRKDIPESMRDPREIDDAIYLLNLIIFVEEYLLAIQRLPWQVGRKISWLEKARLRRIFRVILRDLYDPNTRRAVRGTPVIVELTGSLARGESNYKFIENTDLTRFPKPSDYGIPPKFEKIDNELKVAQELKHLLSDVDILIMNEVIFDSLPQDLSHRPWSFKVGEKYGVPIGPMLGKIHQALMNTKIGGIRARQVNYVVVRDKNGYNNYKAARQNLFDGIQQRTGTAVICKDFIILDEIVSVA